LNEPHPLEHDTLQDHPTAARGRPETAPRRSGPHDRTRREKKEDAGRTGKPWCAFDNPEIWTVIAGDPDDE